MGKYERSNMKAQITALVGAQYGSEGKGVVANYIAHNYDIWVRTGGPNAGHSFLHGKRVWKMQSLPCGWVNPNALLVIGPGAIVNPEILKTELDAIEKHEDPDIRGRVVVDTMATPLLVKHIKEENHTEGSIHKRIGSTGEGVGAARRDWMSRDRECTRPLGEIAHEFGLEDLMLENTPELLEVLISQNKSIMLEGTQGCGLSLTHGKWPFTTSSDTNAGQLCVDAGIPPHKLTNVILVARTFPIRVHGNSGPLKSEKSWDEMSERIGKKVEERTTVTKLVRRIGAWDEDLMRHAVRLNAPKEIALTFLDYLNPKDTGCTEFEKLSNQSRSFIDYIERTFEVKVTLIGTGFDGTHGWMCIDRRA
jgi:adenylosuccinate synthase